MTTPYWSDFVPNSTFYRILSGFHRTFATSVACRQGTLTPPDTWSRPFGTCICSTCWDQSFFRTCRYFTGLCSSNIPRYFIDFALSLIKFPQWTYSFNYHHFVCKTRMLPAATKSQYGKISKSQILTPPPGACDVSEVWATLRWPYSPSLVTVSPPNLSLDIMGTITGAPLLPFCFLVFQAWNVGQGH